MPSRRSLLLGGVALGGAKGNAKGSAKGNAGGASSSSSSSAASAAASASADATSLPALAAAAGRDGGAPPLAGADDILCRALELHLRAELERRLAVRHALAPRTLLGVVVQQPLERRGVECGADALGQLLLLGLG